MTELFEIAREASENFWTIGEGTQNLKERLERGTQNLHAQEG